MKSLRARISIQSSPAAVFNVLTNFDSYREWNPWLRDVRGEAKEGTLVSVRPNMLSLFGLRLKYRLQAIQAKDFLLWQEEAWFSSLFNTVREYQVYTRVGGTAIYSVKLGFHGPLAPLVSLFYGKAVQRGLLREARALKEYCEIRYPFSPKPAA